MSVPSILIVPDVGFKNPVIIRIVVVFPAPFGPSRPTICPVGIEKLTSLTALKVPKMRETLLTSIIYILLCKTGPLYFVQELPPAVIFWLFIF